MCEASADVVCKCAVYYPATRVCKLKSESPMMGHVTQEDATAILLIYCTMQSPGGRVTR